MLGKTERKAAFILAAVVVILVLFYLGSVFLFPNLGVSVYSADSPDGARVVFEGDIISSKITSTGGNVLLDVSGVTVYVENGAERIFWKAGDRIRVYGKVQTYSGKKEIAVLPKDITVIS